MKVNKMKKLWSFRNLLAAIALLGCVTASAAAEAKTYVYYNDYGYAPSAPVRVYQPQQAYYPSSCYYVHEDYLGHHTWRVRPECARPQVIYAPVQQRSPWYNQGYAFGVYDRDHHDYHNDYRDHDHDGYYDRR